MQPFSAQIYLQHEPVPDHLAKKRQNIIYESIWIYMNLALNHQQFILS